MEDSPISDVNCWNKPIINNSTLLNASQTEKALVRVPSKYFYLLKYVH